MSVLNARVGQTSRAMQLNYRAQAQRLVAIIEQVSALPELPDTSFQIGEAKQRLVNALEAARIGAAL